MSDWKSKVLSTHEMNRLPHFKMYKGASATGNPIFMSEDGSGNADNDYEQAHTRLSNALNLLQVPGKYLVQFKEKLANNNVNMSYEFEVPYGYSSSGGNAPAVGSLLPANMVSKDELATILASAKKEWEREQENRELKKQMAEMNAKIGKLSKIENPWPEVVETFKPYLPLVAGVVQKWLNPGAQIGIAGVGGEEVPEFNRTTQQQADTTVVAAATDDTPADVSEAQKKLQHNNARLSEVVAWLVQVKGGDQTAAVDLLYSMMLKGKENPGLITMLEGFLK